MKKYSNPTLLLGATLLAFSAVACGGYSDGREEESPEMQELAWSVAACDDPAPDWDVSVSVNHNSGHPYDTCGKGFITDIDDIEADWISLWWSQGSNYGQSSCTKSSPSDTTYVWGGALLYHWEGGGWVHKQTSETYGEWTGSACVMPHVSVTGITQGDKYRVASSMRLYNADNPTGLVKDHWIASYELQPTAP